LRGISKDRTTVAVSGETSVSIDGQSRTPHRPPSPNVNQCTGPAPGTVVTAPLFSSTRTRPSLSAANQTDPPPTANVGLYGNVERTSGTSNTPTALAGMRDGRVAVLPAPVVDGPLLDSRAIASPRATAMLATHTAATNAALHDLTERPLTSELYAACER